MHQGKSEEKFLVEKTTITTRRKNTKMGIILKILISKKILMSWIAASIVLSLFRIYIDRFVFQIDDLAYIFWVTIREQIVQLSFMTIFLVLLRWRLVRVYQEFLAETHEHEREHAASSHEEQISQLTKPSMNWLFNTEDNKKRFQQGVLKWWNGLLVPFLTFSCLMLILLVVIADSNLRRSLLTTTFSPGNYALFFKSRSIQAIDSQLHEGTMDTLLLAFLVLVVPIRAIYPIFHGLTSVIYLGIFGYYLRRALREYQARLLNTLQHPKPSPETDNVPHPEEFQWSTRPIISSTFWTAIVVVTSLLWGDSVILVRIILRGPSELNNPSFYLFLASVLSIAHVLVLGVALAIFVLPLIPIYHVNRHLKAHYLQPLRKRYTHRVKILLQHPTQDENPSLAAIAEEVRILRKEITALENLPTLPFNYKSLGVIALGPLVSFASLVLSMLQKLLGLYL